MSECVEICGYAVPFNRTRYVAAIGAVELIDPAAFKAMIGDRGRSVPILWDDHDGPQYRDGDTFHRRAWRWLQRDGECCQYRLGSPSGDDAAKQSDRSVLCRPARNS